MICPDNNIISINSFLCFCPVQFFSDYIFNLDLAQKNPFSELVGFVFLNYCLTMNSGIKASSTRKNIVCPLNKLVIIMFASSTMESRENNIGYYFNVNSANGFLCENAQSINCARLFSLFY